MLVASTLASAADVTGTWRGSVTVTNPDGTVRDFVAMMVLKQSGSNVTGWVGDSENKMAGTVMRSDGLRMRIQLSRKR
jgi:hypothetical protein